MILIASALFPPETVVSANLSYDIASKLAENNEVVVLSPRPSKPHGNIYVTTPTFRNFKHIVLNSYICSTSNVIGRLRESISFGRYLSNYIENDHRKISVIYANVWPLFSQRALLKVSRKYKIPVILHIQDIYPESLSEKMPAIKNLINIIFRPIDRKNLKLSQHVITISNQMKEYLIKTRFINRDKFSIVYNWQNNQIFFDYKKLFKKKKDDEFKFMYLGTINSTACVDLLINAFAKSNIKNSSLTIVGNGPEKIKCIELAKKYKKKINFKSASFDQVPEIQNQADVLLLSLKKGVGKTALPSKLTAYMLSGKPVIAAVDVDSGAAEIIKNNSCGWVVEAEKEVKLIECMEKTRGLDVKVLEEMGNAGLRYANKKLSKFTNLSKILTIIQKNQRSI